MSETKIGVIGNGCQIHLNKGKVALVDREDFDGLNKFTWFLDSKGYAVRHTPRKDGPRKWIYMHRVVNQTPEDMFTDHINRVRLDNRKSNLRTVTHQQNTFNQGARGITWHKGMKKWQAQIGLGGRNIYLGAFNDPRDATKARRKAEAVYHV